MALLLKATLIFGDPFAVISIDESMDYGEERLIATGWAGELLLTVVYVERDDRVRMISARRATNYERRIYEQGEAR